MRCIIGGGDIVETLEELVEQAKKGELKLVNINWLDSEGTVAYQTTWHPEIERPWMLALAAASNHQYMLCAEGLE